MLDGLTEKVFQPVVEAVTSMHYSLQLSLIVVVIIITQGPKILALRARWIDYRLNRNKLQFEKERLETLKLHYEIQALKKEHGLTTDEFETELFRESPKSALKFRYPEFPQIFRKLEAHIEKKSLWQWVESNPKAGKIVLNILYYIIAFYAYITAFATISLFAVTVFDETFAEETGTEAAAGIIIIYLIFCAVLFYWKKVYSHWLALLAKIK